MPTIWENSYVDRLKGLHSRKAKVEQAVEDVRQAIEPLIGPDAAKILIAIATDVVAGIQSRNDLTDVNDAYAALRKALELLEAVDPNLDG